MNELSQKHTKKKKGSKSYSLDGSERAKKSSIIDFIWHPLNPTFILNYTHVNEIINILNYAYKRVFSFFTKFIKSTVVTVLKIGNQLFFFTSYELLLHLNSGYKSDDDAFSKLFPSATGGGDGPAVWNEEVEDGAGAEAATVDSALALLLA